MSPLLYSIYNAPVIIEAYAVHYGIPAQPLIDTLYCESQFNPSVVGDKQTSFGIAQIHLPAHKDVTKKQALNPFFAIDWAASQFAAGNASIWSCYKQLYGSQSP